MSPPEKVIRNVRASRSEKKGWKGGKIENVLFSPWQAAFEVKAGAGKVET
jgi:hypothetical protein